MRSEAFKSALRALAAAIILGLPVTRPPACAAEGASLFPIRVSADKRHLEDAGGKPFLLHGDTAWSLIVQLGKEETGEYLENRRQKGFNAIVVNLLEYYYAADPPKTVSGVAPFTTPGDFSTPNEAYFAHAGWVVQKAAEKGILVLLNPCYLGANIDGWWREVEANGPAKCRDYGRYLGLRFKGATNIIWVAGGDQTPVAGSARETNWREILLGIKDHAPGHLWTAHWHNDIDAVDVPAFLPHIDLNGVYAYGACDQRMLHAYSRSDIKPIFMWECWYEGLNWSGKVTPPEVLRRQAYWANLAGSTGQNFGSNHVWSFGARTHRKNAEPDVDWRKGMEKPGSREMVHLKSLFAGRAWHRLVPDQQHHVVTAGFGVSGNPDYVMAARTDDGSLVMAYIPPTATATRTLTLDMTKLRGRATAQWFNPVSGGYTSIPGSPFANTGTRDFTTPGDNGAGTNDWVLVLEAGASKTR